MQGSSIRGFKIFGQTKEKTNRARIFSTKTGRHAVFITVVKPMDDEQGLRDFFAIYQKQESRLARILGSHFRTQDFGAI